jgi:acyl carrier protein
MTDDDVLQRLLPHIMEVTGAKAQEITPSSVLMADLGAESLDLLDLSFLIEEEFGILLEADAIEHQATMRMGGTAYEQDGFLTEAGIREITRVIPELVSPAMTPPLRKSVIPSLLTVGAFVRLIQLKLAEKAEVHSHAQG